MSSGERKRMMVKPCACDTRQGLRVRGCGAVLWSSAGGRARVLAGSRNCLGRRGVVGDTPVGGTGWCVSGTVCPSSTGLVESCVNLPRPLGCLNTS